MKPYHGQTDIYGNMIEDRIYNNRDYDYNIILKDRIDEVAREITEYLKAQTGCKRLLCSALPKTMQNA